MADIKQIKVGDETYNIEPFSQYIKPTVNSEYYPKFIQTKYSKDSSSWYGKDYPMYGFWETNTICKITVDNYSTKVDMAVKDANQNVITDTYATKKAVTQEIKDAIDGLIDGAPGTLNTLKELSAAIGNDKDYAATVTNLITGIDTKVTNETTRAEAAEKTLGKKIGENTNAIAVNANSFKTSITGLSVNGRVITYTKGDGTTGTITTQDTHDNTHLFRLDTRTLNKDPYDTDNYLSRLTWHLKTNSAIGITGQGDYSGLLQLTPWADKSGGSSHQLAFGTNGAIYHRYGTTSWSNWSALAHEGWVSSNYLPRAGGKMTGNIRMSENSTSIIFRDTSTDGTKSWLSGIYANSTGDEVLGIVAKNTRTHIMLGNADPEARPACTSLTPAIDIKNGKVGINKRIGTDSSADAGSYELDVNGAIRANGSVDASSARISNGLYVGSSITHNEQENLIIGNSSNNGCVNFVEDISVGSDMLTINTSGDIYAEGGFYVAKDVNIEGDIYTDGSVDVKGNINFNSTPLGITANAFNAGEGETCKSVIGFNGEGDPSVISNSGYIRLYDAGPNGNDGLLTLADSPTYSISMDDLDMVCHEGWNKTNTSNKTKTKMYLVGATAQTSNQKTYSNFGCYIGTDNSLYSNNKKTAVEELTMPVTKKFLREHKSEYREPLVDSNCKHFSLIDLYVKDDSGELHDVNFVLTVFGTINVVWGYSDESIENSKWYPAGSATTRCRNGIRLVGYINHLTKTFTGSMLEKPHSSNTERTIRRFVNEPITHFSASIDHCMIDGSMIWWSLDSASTDIKAL